MPSFRVVSPMLLSFAVAACAAGSADAPSPMFAPMPMGETALARPNAVVVKHPVEIELTWTDGRGRTWDIAFRCEYATDDAHQLLAAACMQSNVLAAHETGLAVCRSANLDTIAGIVACEQNLQAQLTDVLFPCTTELADARVTGIEWTLWLVR